MVRFHTWAPFKRRKMASSSLQLELVSQLATINTELDKLTNLLITADDGNAQSQLEIISSIAEAKSTLIELVRDLL